MCVFAGTRCSSGGGRIRATHRGVTLGELVTERRRCMQANQFGGGDEVRSMQYRTNGNAYCQGYADRSRCCQAEATFADCDTGVQQSSNRNNLGSLVTCDIFDSGKSKGRRDTDCGDRGTYLVNSTEVTVATYSSSGRARKWPTRDSADDWPRLTFPSLPAIDFLLCLGTPRQTWGPYTLIHRHSDHLP